MTDLIKADFYRIRKDVMLLIALIVLVVFALSTPVMYALLGVFAKDSLAELETMGMSLSLSGKYVFISSLSLTNNFGIILPVLIGILVCRDFSAGTVRNKIISGHSKASVYSSILLTSAATGIALFLLYALLSLGAGCLFLGYGSEFNMSELLYILKALLMGAFIFGAATSLAVFLASLTRSIGLTILFQVVAAIAVAALGSINMLIPNAPEWLTKISRLNPAHQITLASAGTIDSSLLAVSLISAVAYIAVLTVTGMQIFLRSDQK